VGAIQQLGAASARIPQCARELSFPAVAESVCICRLGLQIAREAALTDRSDRRDIVMATAGALILGVLLSWGAVYGLNRYLGPGDDPAETTGALHPLPRAD
jgi:hypothetical protein